MARFEWPSCLELQVLRLTTLSSLAGHGVLTQALHELHRKKQSHETSIQILFAGCSSVTAFVKAHCLLVGI